MARGAYAITRQGYKGSTVFFSAANSVTIPVQASACGYVHQIATRSSCAYGVSGSSLNRPRRHRRPSECHPQHSGIIFGAARDNQLQKLYASPALHLHSFEAL